MFSKRVLSFGLICVIFFSQNPNVYADIIRGVGYVASGVLEIPRATLAGTFGGPPIIGTVFGLLGGTLNSVGLLTKGVLELAGSAVPLATKLVPLIPLFL